MSILKLCVIRSYKEPWYVLTPAEQNELTGKVTQVTSQVGGKNHLICASFWSNEKWMGWALEEYPDLAAVQMQGFGPLSFNWFRYVDSLTMLGTQIYPEGPIIIPKAPIYKLALFRMKDNYLVLPKAEQKMWNERIEDSYQATGTQVICFAKSSWCDEQWQGWCIEAYPDLESLQKRADFMEESGWYRYSQAISSLGMRFPLET